MEQHRERQIVEDALKCIQYCTPTQNEFLQYIQNTKVADKIKRLIISLISPQEIRSCSEIQIAMDGVYTSLLQQTVNMGRIITCLIASACVVDIVKSYVDKEYLLHYLSNKIHSELDTWVKRNIPKGWEFLASSPHQ